MHRACQSTPSRDVELLRVTTRKIQLDGLEVFRQFILAVQPPLGREGPRLPNNWSIIKTGSTRVHRCNNVAREQNAYNLKQSEVEFHVWATRLNENVGKIRFFIVEPPRRTPAWIRHKLNWTPWKFLCYKLFISKLNNTVLRRTKKNRRRSRQLVLLDEVSEWSSSSAFLTRT